MLSVAALAGAMAGCGGSGSPRDASPAAPPSAAALRAQLRAATSSSVSDFPAVRGRTIQQVADDLTGTGTELGLAGSIFTPGRQRVAFGVIDREARFVYGKTALYVASGPNAPARGPFPAPADLLITDREHRSRQAASEGDLFAAIYTAQVPLARPGPVALLAVTRLADGRTVGAGTTIRVIPRERDPVVAVGAPAPAAHTDTRASAGGDLAAIDTRSPHDSMHDVDLADVAGRRPVALLFATPALCESRVCGPVVDVAEQLKRRYGRRIAFIHQEVYVGNDPSKGLRLPLRRFGLRSEPWLFVLDRQGRVAARLEGSFGFAAFEQALRAGLS